MVKSVILKKQDAEHLLGQFLDKSHYDILIDNEDVDVYSEHPFDKTKMDEENIVVKFRKDYFTKEEQHGAYDGLKDAAKTSQNRGIAAGPKGAKYYNREWVTAEELDILNYLMNLNTDVFVDIENDLKVIREKAKLKDKHSGAVWLTEEKKNRDFDFDKWLNSIINDSSKEYIPREAQKIHNELISRTRYANAVDSGIAGWYDRYVRIPYGRPTAYTHYNFEKFQLCYPFARNLARGFRDLLPERYKNQMERIKKLDPSFYIPGTPFTTITVNRNFRTAAHRDAGDLHTGFSNLTVVAKNKQYTGGYLVLPEFRAAVNIRPGDLLLVNNHEYIHGNTPIEADVDADDFERISLVFYFRDKMSELGTRDYEDQRHHFVESRRTNPDHPEWKKDWNGISPDMWESQEWFNYLRDVGKEEYISKYHQTDSTLF